MTFEELYAAKLKNAKKQPIIPNDQHRGIDAVILKSLTKHCTVHDIMKRTSIKEDDVRASCRRLTATCAAHKGARYGLSVYIAMQHHDPAADPQPKDARRKKAG
jgi:hypothetical protein